MATAFRAASPHVFFFVFWFFLHSPPRFSMQCTDPTGLSSEYGRSLLKSPMVSLSSFLCNWPALCCVEEKITNISSYLQLFSFDSRDHGIQASKEKISKLRLTESNARYLLSPFGTCTAVTVGGSVHVITLCSISARVLRMFCLRAELWAV